MAFGSVLDASKAQERLCKVLCLPETELQCACLLSGLVARAQGSCASCPLKCALPGKPHN